MTVRSCPNGMWIIGFVFFLFVAGVVTIVWMGVAQNEQEEGILRSAGVTAESVVVDTDFNLYLSGKILMHQYEIIVEHSDGAMTRFDTNSHYDGYEIGDTISVCRTDKIDRHWRIQSNWLGDYHWHHCCNIFTHWSCASKFPATKVAHLQDRPCATTLQIENAAT